jgi:hypothetical protein
MTALLVIAALFGGLLWAGRSRRRYDQIVYDYDPDLVATDDAYCDCDCNDDGAAADTSGDSSGGGE